MRLRQLEQAILAVVGFALVVGGIVVSQIDELPDALRAAFAVPFIAAGAASCWAATLGWPRGEPDERRESPAILLPVERVFLAPLGALGALGFIGLVRDRNMQLPVKLLLIVSTLVVTSVLIGLVVGRVRLPSRHLGRQQPRPAPPRGTDN